MKPTITLHHVDSLKFSPIQTITAHEHGRDGVGTFSSRRLTVTDGDGDTFDMTFFSHVPSQLAADDDTQLERQVKADNVALLERHGWILQQHDETSISVYGPDNPLGRVELGRIRVQLVVRLDGGAHTYLTASRLFDGVGRVTGSAPELWRAMDILLRSIEYSQRPQITTDRDEKMHYDDSLDCPAAR